MIIDDQPVWLLHKRPKGDSSLLLTLFSPNGLIKATFKGARQSASKNLLQPFIPLWASLRVWASHTFVSRLEQADTPLLLQGGNLFCGFYLNELLYYSLHPEEPNPDLYKAYVEALKALHTLTDKDSLEITLRRFEWTLLESLGYGLCLDKVADSLEAINPDEHYRFKPALGLVNDPTGFSGANLLDFSSGNFSNPVVLKIAKFIMRQAIDNLLDGKKLKSRALFG